MHVLIMYFSSSECFFLYIVMTTYCVVMIVSVEIDFNFHDKVPEGEQRYGELKEKAKSYGECWKEAMSDLHVGCKRLTEETQSRLALSFSNCFLRHTGLDNPSPCGYEVPVASCLKNSTDRFFNTYTEFYTHTQSICHYLQHREWQEEAAKTVLMLTQSSEEVGKKLSELSKSQTHIQDLQHTVLYGQQRLLSNGKRLNVELQQSRDNARNVYNEFKLATDEQKFLLFEVFDRVKNLQNFVLGEFTGVYTIAYYIIAAIIIYIVTSIPRTAEARIWLILVITLSACLEQFFTSYSLEEIITTNPFETNELVFSRIWMCRKVACIVCIIVLIMCYYRYKDYNRINNELLREIQQQNLELQMFIKGMNLSGTSRSILINSADTPQILHKTVPEKNSITDYILNINKSRSSVNFLKDSTPNLNSEMKYAEIKENISFSPVDLAPRTKGKNNGHEIKATKRTTEKKKPNSIKNPGKMQESPPQLENILSELVSPVSQSHTLRRSNRIKSPKSPT